MIRRSFLKMLAAVLAAPFAVKGKPEPEVITANTTEPVQEWHGTGPEVCSCRRCKSKAELGNWLGERLEQDMIKALSGITG